MINYMKKSIQFLPIFSKFSNGTPVLGHAELFGKVTKFRHFTIAVYPEGGKGNDKYQSNNSSNFSFSRKG